MGSRYYNPRVGRFITQDSFGATFGADWTEHLYSYGNNNPVNMIDPTGHISLRYGMMDNGDVKALQIMLNALKFNSGTPDGDFGDNTLAAVNAFKDTYLKDGNKGKWRGVVGDQTWALIGKLYLARQKTSSRYNTKVRNWEDEDELDRLEDQKVREKGRASDSLKRDKKQARDAWGPRDTRGNASDEYHKEKNKSGAGGADNGTFGGMKNGEYEPLSWGRMAAGAGLVFVGTVGTAVLAADDATGFGTIDDVLLPVTGSWVIKGGQMIFVH